MPKALMAVGVGVEPALRESKSRMLPLHHPTMYGRIAPPFVLVDAEVLVFEVTEALLQRLRPTR